MLQSHIRHRLLSPWSSQNTLKTIKKALTTVIPEVIRGRATPEGTAELADRGPLEYRSIPLANLSISRVGFGGDDMGVLPDARGSALRRAVGRRGVNVVEIDVDEVLARHDPSSSLYEVDEKYRRWEYHALWSCLQGCAREGLVVVGVASLGSTNVYSGAYGPEMLKERVERAAEMLRLEDGFDLLMAQIPGSSSEYGSVDVRSTVRALERVVDEGLAGYYGLGSFGFSTLNMDEKRQPLRRVLKEAELCRRERSGNSSSGAAGVGSPIATAEHRFVVIRYTCNLLEHSALLPSAQDASGRQWSLAELASDFGLAQFGKSAFDCVHGGRPFRTVDCVMPEMTDSDMTELADNLNECVDYAIHLERMYDTQVKEAVEAELASSQSDTTAPASDKVCWGRVIGYNLHRLDSLLEWEYLWWARVDPSLTETLRITGSTKVAKEWARAYQAVMLSLQRGMNSYLEWRHHPRARSVASLLDQALPALETTPALHSKVARLLLSSPLDTILTETPEAIGERGIAPIFTRIPRSKPIFPKDSFDFLTVTQPALQSPHLHPDTLVPTMLPPFPKEPHFKPRDDPPPSRIAKRLFEYPTKEERQASEENLQRPHPSSPLPHNWQDQAVPFDEAIKKQ